MLFVLLISILVLTEGTPVLNGRDVGVIKKSGSSFTVNNPAKYPYVVFLDIHVEYHEINRVRKVNNFCGGSLIAPAVVLTAAHCLTMFIPEPMIFITPGIVHRELERATQFAEVTDMLVHEDFIEWDYFKFKQNDIALLWVSKRFELNKYVKLAKLPSSANDLDHQMVIILGWGLTEKGYDSKMLKEADIKIVPKHFCARLHDPAEITNSMLCAFSKKKDVLPCMGDSGGPVVYKGVIYGINSWSHLKTSRRDDGKIIDTCDPSYPAVFTKVIDYIPWINKNLDLGAPKLRLSGHSHKDNDGQEKESKPACVSSKPKENCIIL